jgi:hypothetical protein
MCLTLFIEQRVAPEVDMMASMETTIQQHGSVSDDSLLQTYGISVDSAHYEEVEKCIDSNEVMTVIEDRESRLMLCATQSNLKDVVKIGTIWRDTHGTDKPILDTLRAQASTFLKSLNNYDVELENELVMSDIRNIDQLASQQNLTDTSRYVTAFRALFTTDEFMIQQQRLSSSTRIDLDNLDVLREQVTLYRLSKTLSVTGKYFAAFSPFNLSFAEHVREHATIYTCAMAIIRSEKLSWVTKIKILTLMMPAPPQNALTSEDLQVTNQTLRMSEAFKQRLLWVTMMATAAGKEFQHIEFLQFQEHVQSFWNELSRTQVPTRDGRSFSEMFQQVCVLLNEGFPTIIYDRGREPLAQKLDALVSKMHRMAPWTDLDRRLFDRLPRDEVNQPTTPNLFTISYVELYNHLRQHKPISELVNNAIYQVPSELNHIPTFHNVTAVLTSVANAAKTLLSGQRHTLETTSTSTPATKRIRTDENDLESNRGSSPSEDSTSTTDSFHSVLTEPTPRTTHTPRPAPTIHLAYTLVGLVQYARRPQTWVYQPYARVVDVGSPTGVQA